MSVASYLKKHTEALVKEVGIEAACELTGKSKATLGRYYSDSAEHDDRFMPIDVVAQLCRRLLDGGAQLLVDLQPPGERAGAIGLVGHRELAP